MLRLSKMTDYAVVIMAQMGVHARDGRGLSSASALADRTGLPEPTVAKILKTLSGAKLVQSQRGPVGGYGLSRVLENISLLEIVRVMEGDIAIVACAEKHEGVCASENKCPVRGHWDPVNRALNEALSRVTLADMVAAGSRPGDAVIPIENRTGASL